MRATRRGVRVPIGRLARFAATFFAVLLAWGAARAESGDPDYLVFGAGAYELERPDHAAQIRAEYRFAQSLWYIKPMLGVLVTNEKTVIPYAGFRLDLYLARHWVLTPNAAFAAFYRGDGRNLGSRALEFKTGLELDYRFDDHSRLGVAFDHVSNAGITKTNPGANSAVLYYAIPINLFGPRSR